MKIYDITRELLSAPVYDGDTAPILKKVGNIKQGGFNTSDITMCLHNGTHVDAPLHAVADGDSLETLPLAKFFGECSVVSLEKIGIKDVVKLRKRGVKRLLLRGSKVTPVVAIELSFLNLDVIGVENQSIGEKNVHKSFLARGTAILEGLDLSNVPDGDYILVALPLKINGADGSPVRAMLVQAE